MKNKTLNLETYNEILVSAGIPLKELLEMEIQTAYGLKVSTMEELVEALNKKKSISEIEDILQKVNNIDSNLDVMMSKLKEIDPQTKEEETNHDDEA